MGKSESRVTNSVRNIFFSIIFNLIQLLVAFISRYFLIKELGAEYLGINSAFSSLLTLLSVAELGIGEAISFALYKPLAAADSSKIKKILVYLRKWYVIIAFVIFSFGMAMIPLLPFFIGDSIKTINSIYLIYILYVVNSVSSYIFGYTKVLLIADQRNYVVSNLTSVLSIIFHSVQLIVLILTKNYVFYLLFQIGFTVSTNLLLYIYTRKTYTNLFPLGKENLSKEERQSLRRTLFSLFIQRIGAVTEGAIDALIISSMFGTIVAGKYSNYVLITTYCNQFCALLFGAVAGSVGDFISKKTPSEAMDLFFTIELATFWIYSFASIGILVCSEDFIRIIANEDYVLNRMVLIFITCNFYIRGMRENVTLFKNDYGLYWETKFVPLAKTIINVVLSILLARIWGVVGVIVATTIMYACTLWRESYVLFKDGFLSSPKKYYLRYALFFLGGAACALIFSCSFLIPSTNKIADFFIKFSIVTIGVNSLYFILFHKTQSFSYFLNVFKRTRKSIVDKRNRKES